jgi:hypothetical protein
LSCNTNCSGCKRLSLLFKRTAIPVQSNMSICRLRLSAIKTGQNLRGSDCQALCGMEVCSRINCGVRAVVHK